jgi:hypothetical protein
MAPESGEAGTGSGGSAGRKAAGGKEGPGRPARAPGETGRGGARGHAAPVTGRPGSETPTGGPGCPQPISMFLGNGQSPPAPARTRPEGIMKGSPGQRTSRSGGSSRTPGSRAGRGSVRSGNPEEDASPRSPTAGQRKVLARHAAQGQPKSAFVLSENDGKGPRKSSGAELEDSGSWPSAWAGHWPRHFTSIIKTRQNWREAFRTPTLEGPGAAGPAAAPANPYRKAGTSGSALRRNSMLAVRVRASAAASGLGDGTGSRLAPSGPDRPGHPRERHAHPPASA